jgi:hypothetical protein
MRFVCGRRRDEHRARRDAQIHRTTPTRARHLDLAIVDNVVSFNDVHRHECLGDIPPAELLGSVGLTSVKFGNSHRDHERGPS